MRELSRIYAFLKMLCNAIRRLHRAGICPYHPLASVSSDLGGYVCTVSSGESRGQELIG